MIKGLKTTELGMLPKSLKLDIIANNLANLNTVGFKKSDIFVRELINADLAFKKGGSLLRERNISQEQYYDFAQGSLQETSNPLDFAINGKGFFVIETENGLRYTKNGNFSISQDGALVNSDGLKVMGDKGPIYFPNPALMQQKQITIMKNGNLLIGNEVIAKLQVVGFKDDESGKNLKFEGKNLINISPEGSMYPEQISDYEIKQGFLENSNVNALEEMVKMIELNTSMQADQKSIRYQDQTLQITNEIGKI